MSTLLTKNIQLGSDATATNNFTIFQPATPDGTLRIGNGNTGITSSLLTLTSAGNLGVGAAPIASNIRLSAVADAAMNTVFGGRSFGINCSINASAAGGTQASPTASTGSTAPLNLVGACTYDGTNYLNVTSMVFGLEATPTVSSAPSFVAFSTTPSGTTSRAERVRITASGDVGIGTSTPGYKLDVRGSGYFGNGTIGNLVGQDGVNAYVGTTTNHPLALYTNGAIRATLDASGNLGLGVTPSAWGAAYPGRIQGLGWAIATPLDGGTDTSAFATNAYNSAASTWNYRNNAPAALYQQFSGTHRWYTAPSGTAGNAITFTQAMTLDANGRLFVNATSTTEDSQMFVSGIKSIISGIPLNQIGVADASALAAGVGGAINFIGTYTSGGLRTSFASIEASKDNATSGQYGAAMVFKTRQDGGAQAERARINSSGHLLVGTTTTPTGATTNAFYTNLSGAWPLNARGNDRGISFILGAAEGYAAYFERGQSSVLSTCGYIYLNTNNTTTYATSSDYRLKENIAPMTGALAKVAAMKPCTYTWKSDGSSGDGFIAHELQEVVPQAVHGAKDAVREDGTPEYQGIDTGFLVATLTAAIQELKAELDTVKAELKSLKG